MGSTLATFGILFDDRVRDAASRITADARARAIDAAVSRYTQVRPAVAVKDYPGDGATFDFALPLDWEEGFSTIPEGRLEYPAGEREPRYLERDAWTFYRAPAGTVLRLTRDTPANGKTLRATYTTRHTVDATGSTIPPLDEGAVADLAASIGLRGLAAFYANTQDPTIAADVVNYRSKAEEYSRLADKLEGQYRAHLRLDKQTEARAASAFTDDDQEPTHRLGKLTHPNETR